ncbi:MAG: Hsp20/alpha crystallin family protein [Paludisphaera borealis]|uniref:Hsp20/alpha crystallin family protein n=1 Tax=Paludisphaera borealis TaxID=1387353 RepID=UPI00284D96C6|nr:Hsp20/alpha crystallin family protein [Paludisphaera borealis]MDR3621847.1 Hsp20/alpha crystallin family protein [Paludisphaera borealis]
MTKPDMSWSNQWRRERRIPFELLQNEFRRFVEEYLQPGPSHGPGGEPGPSPGPGGEPGPFAGPGGEPGPHREPTGGRPWSPPVDVYETPEEVVVVVEIPGVDASQVELSVANSLLIIRGTRTPGARPDAHLRLRERRFGSFLRQVAISGEVDFDAAQAETVNGVLTIRLPRRQVSAPRTIPVRPG